MALTRVSRHIIDEPLELQNINATGIGTFASLRVTGDLQVDGTTTTLDTVVTEVDRLEVLANNSTVGAAITQSGTGDILNLYDGSTEVFTVTDGGKVGIEAPNPSGNLNISYLQVGKGQVSSDHSLYNYNTSFTNNAYQNGNGTFAHITNRAVGVINIQDNVLTFSNGPGGTAGQSATLTERFRITSDGNIGLAGQTNPTDSLHIGDFSAVGYELKFSRNAVQFRRAGNSFIDQKDDAGNIVFRTTSSNTERLRITSDGKVRVPDGGKFVAGAGDDLQIYHNGTHSYIDHVTSGALIIRNTSNDVDVVIESDDGSGGLANYFRADGSTGDAILYHYGNVKLATKSTGIQVTGQIDIGTTSIYGTGDISMGDSDKLRLGGGDDLEIFHNGGQVNESFVDNKTGNLNIRNFADDKDIVIQSDNGSGGLANYIVCDGSEGSVILSHLGNTRIQTTNTGASVTGNFNVSGHIYLNDNREVVIGAGNDLKIYHDGSINRIRSDVLTVIEKNDSEDMASFMPDGAVVLFHNGSQKFETTTTGAKVTGALEVTQEYPSIRPILDLNFAATKSLDRRITFSRRGIATYTAENGLIKYAATNEPRFDHDPTTGESLGLLIEEGRTNYAVYSSEFDNAAHSKYDATVSANQAVAPDGTTTADLMYPNSSGTSRGIEDVYTLPSTGIYTTSLYVKAAGLSWVQLYSVNGGKRAFFNVATGVKGGHAGTGSLEDWDIIDAGNGWYRIYVTYNLTSISSNEYYYLYFAGGDGNGTVTANGTDGVYMWGLQVEKGSFPTSYIPTSESTVTREADYVTIKGTNFTDFYNQNEGTFFVDSAVARGSGYNTYVGSVTSSTANGGPSYNFNSLMSDNDNSDILLNIWDGTGSAQAMIAIAHPSGNMRVAGAFKNNDFAISMNGSAVSTDTSGTIDTNQDQLWIGKTPYNDTNWLNNPIKRVAYYKTRLPNAQLQGLTQQ